tara:strand:+ start:2418 stop:4244 length:1827 start_codon:yes stop_codon:yes gene_type:complete
MADRGSFYGYVKRDDKAFVDWGAIGTQLSDDLALESKRRQDKRQEIELQTIEDVKEINKLGANQDQLNGEFYMDAADQIRDFLLMSQTEMQKGGWGGLRPSEFLKQRQVVNDGVDQLASAAKSQAAQQEELMKRVIAGEAGGSEEFNAEIFEKFNSTEGRSLYINPVNGRMYIATRDPDTGELLTNEKDLMDVNNLSKLMSYRANNPNIGDLVAEAGKTLKPTTIALTQGGIKSIKSAMNNSKYLDAEKSIINGMLISDTVTGDILVQGEYSYTSDPAVAKADPKKILMKKNGSSVFTAELTEAQKTEAEEILRARIRASLEKVQTNREPNQNNGLNFGGTQRQAEDITTTWSKLYVTKDPVARKQLASNIISTTKALTNGLIDIQFTKISNPNFDSSRPEGPGNQRMAEAVEFRYKGGEKDRTGKNAILIGENPTTENWDLIGTEISGQSSPRLIKIASGVYGDNPTWGGSISGVSASRDAVDVVDDKEKGLRFFEEADSKVDTLIRNFDKSTQKQSFELVASLSSIYAGSGVIFEKTGMQLSPGGRKIKVTVPAGKDDIVVEYPNSKAGIESIKGFLKSKIIEADAIRAYELRGNQVSSGVDYSNK